MATSAHAFRSNENLAPQEAIEFENEVKKLEQQRMEAHEKLKAQGGTAEQHKAIDDDTLAKARQLEAKRTKALKDLGKKAGIGDIKQGDYGTEPTKGRGALGDVDTKSYSGKDFDKIRQAAKDAGYTVTTDGDSMHIKELDTTVHRESSQYKSETGSSAAEAEKAGGYGKETSRKLQSGDKTTEVLDNIGKNGHTLNKPANQMKSSDWQELGKMTGRNMDAAGITDPKFREQLEALKQGYRPESIGIEDMEAFQAKCRQANMEATQKVRTEAKVTENKLEQKLDQAKKDLETAKAKGNPKKIEEVSQEINKTQRELSEHRQTQKVAEDSLKKNQPKEAKKILEETKPPEKMPSNSQKKFKPAKPADADDLAQKTGKPPADADDLLPDSKGTGKGKKAITTDADDLVPKTSKPTGPNPKLPPGQKPPNKYVKVTKNAATGAIQALTIFSAAEDLKEKAKQGDIKGFTKALADNMTGGAVTITEQNVEKYSDYQEFKNKIDYANKTEYEAYILRVGKALREKDVPAEEADRIMDAMRRQDLSAYKDKLAELKKDGKTISVAPPNLTGRSWNSFFVDGDEDILTRTADVFVGIGEGLLAMPGKSQKFLSEANEDLYEIFGGIRVNPDGSLDINAGIFEKGVIEELYNQKVESANNLLDIARNEFRTYSVNKEIEEQKAQKDKLQQQKEVREKLMAQGIPFEKANAIAKKAVEDGNWEDFRKARLNIQSNKEAKDFAEKAGVYPEDLEQFLDCMCSACGGSLGGSYDPAFECDIGHGPCRCNGPLTIWKTPIPAGDKERQYECFNLITRMRYEEAQAVFDEWRRIMVEANAKSVEKEVKEIEDLIAREEFMGAADIYSAIESLIKDYMVTKYYDGKPQGENISYKLSVTIKNGLMAQAEADAKNPEMENPLGSAVTKINKACSISKSSSNGYCEEMQGKITAWEKNWKDVVSKEFPAAADLIKQGKIYSATTALQSISPRIMSQQLPNRSKDPMLVGLWERLKAKQKEYDAAFRENTEMLAKLNKEPDPRGVVRTIEAFKQAWEPSQMTLEMLNYQLGVAAQTVRLAEAADKEGDAYREKGLFPNAIERYRISLKGQKDASVQRKLDSLLSRVAEEKEAKQTGEKQSAGRDGSAGCRSDNDCPPGYVCNSGTGKCGSPFDDNYSSFGKISITRDDERSTSQATRVAVNQKPSQKTGFSSSDLEKDLENVQKGVALPPAQTRSDSPQTGSKTSNAKESAGKPVSASAPVVTGARNTTSEPAPSGAPVNKPQVALPTPKATGSNPGAGTKPAASSGSTGKPPVSSPPEQILTGSTITETLPIAQPKPSAATPPTPSQEDAGFDPKEFLGTWTYSGSRPDGKKRSGTMAFYFGGGPPWGGTMAYSIVDEDGQSNGKGNGTWTVEEGPSDSAKLTLSLGGKTWTGPISGEEETWVFYSSHGTYNFRK